MSPVRAAPLAAETPTDVPTQPPVTQPPATVTSVPTQPPDTAVPPTPEATDTLQPPQTVTPPPPPVPPSEIPEPITVILFGTGLAALSAAAARRKKAE